jgi:hypothetical protein
VGIGAPAADAQGQGITGTSGSLEITLKLDVPFLPALDMPFLEAPWW